jgi:hypothetical protein
MVAATPLLLKQCCHMRLPKMIGITGILVVDHILKTSGTVGLLMWHNSLGQNLSVTQKVRPAMIAL